MLSWLFKKNGDEIKKIHSKFDSAFSRVKADMDSVGKWINHFNSKHEDHDKVYQLLTRKIQKIESRLAALEYGGLAEPEDIIEETIVDDPEIQISTWDTLTETHQKICWQLAAIQKELPNQWVSLKYLAQEMYPEKSYNQVRSTLSQYVASLEELGYVKRVRKGKQAYIFSTEKNPCIKKKKILDLRSSK